MHSPALGGTPVRESQIPVIPYVKTCDYNSSYRFVIARAIQS
jgi:hypothetical protein